VIPGVAGAQGRVGPPLERFARRAYVGGIVPNSPQNLVAWILDPPAIDPQTAMPATGVGEPEARDIAAYLCSLH
jgi:cytochrome c1